MKKIVTSTLVLLALASTGCAGMYKKHGCHCSGDKKEKCECGGEEKKECGCGAKSESKP